MPELDPFVWVGTPRDVARLWRALQAGEVVFSGDDHYLASVVAASPERGELWALGDDLGELEIEAIVQGDLVPPAWYHPFTFVLFAATIKKLIEEDPVVRSTYAALRARGLDEDDVVKEIGLAYVAVWRRLWFGGVNLSNDPAGRRALFNAAMYRLAGGRRADDLLDGASWGQND